MTLPLLSALDRPASRAPAPGTGARPANEQVLAGVRVLVVDDEPDSRELVVVSDIRMPGMSGDELLRTLRAHSAPRRLVPAVALTAFAAYQDAQRAREAGFDAHLPKPVEPVMLVDLVATLAAEHQRRAPTITSQTF